MGNAHLDFENLNPDFSIERTLSVIHIINVTYFLFSAANVFVVFVPDTEYCFMYRKTFRLWNRVVAFGIYMFNIKYCIFDVLRKP